MDEGLVYINCLPLKTLKLNHCSQITDRGLAHLVFLSSLTNLDLTECDLITDRGLFHLAFLPLKNLDLNECGLITDVGLVHLGQLTSLLALDLDGCRKITQTSLQNLKDTLKNLRVRAPVELYLHHPKAIIFPGTNEGDPFCWNNSLDFDESKRPQ